MNERQALEIEYEEVLERRNAAIRARGDADAAIEEANREIEIFERIRKRLRMPVSGNGRPMRPTRKQDKTSPRQVVLECIYAHPEGLASEQIVHHSITRMKSNAADKTTLVRTTLYQLKKRRLIELRDGRYFARAVQGDQTI